MVEWIAAAIGRVPDISLVFREMSDTKGTLVRRVNQSSRPDALRLYTRHRRKTGETQREGRVFGCTDGEAHQSSSYGLVDATETPQASDGILSSLVSWVLHVCHRAADARPRVPANG